MRIFSANVDLEKAQASRNTTERIRMHESPESTDMLSVVARECYPELGDLFRRKVVDTNRAKSTSKFFLRFWG